MYLFVGHDLWCPFHVSQFEKGGVMELGKLIPQIFFDILARWIPGLTVTVAWIILLGHSAWSNALNLVLAGHLGNNNALPAVSLSLTVVPFIVGYLIAPLAKGVQRGNEHAWWFLPDRQWVSGDEAVGNGYDQLRLKHPDAGALCAKIRAEFTMYNALAPAAALIAIMAQPILLLNRVRAHGRHSSPRLGARSGGCRRMTSPAPSSVEAPSGYAGGY